MRTGSLLRLLLTFALSILYAPARGDIPQRPSPNGAVDPAIGPVANLSDACEPKTINYITHTLPQQCHKSAWSAAVSTSSPETVPTETALPATTTTNQPEPAKTGATDDDAGHDMTTTTFMSFEEWKEMMLKKQGQDPADARSRKQHENRADNDGSNSEMDTLGDDGEIDLNFDVLSDKITEYTGHGSSRDQARDEQQEGAAREDPNAAPMVRSKDAGKTCKERFSYSSFDAGATVLKTSPGAKNAKAILVETKDTYMLLECAKPNKFLVVELSDDILVDTVVLANYEFFSSMIRHFRVSVSDRYPVKADKWKVLGTFEARNSRDIQAFLVENPAIWAKYLRIEFLTHYGNEYYCPISLLRVHGTRMLETWKEADVTDDDDSPEEIEAPPQVTASDPVVATQPVVSDLCSQYEDSKSPVNLFLRAESRDMCPVASPTVHDGQGPSAVAQDGAFHVETISKKEAAQAKASKGENHMDREEPSTATPSSTNSPPSAAPDSPAAKASDSSSPQRVQASPSPASAAVQESPSTPSKPKSASSNGRPNQQVPPNGGGSPTSTKNKTSTSAGAASPTVQDSFFKTVSKRLAQLESNTNMSMQYIESQSRFLQQTLQSLERKQLAKVDSFLDELNTTVLSELRVLKQQYDQVWQSTVIALESQKEQSARESVALSHRIQLLADEVVFQKRMAIAQAVLSVAALGLVVFQTRAVSGAGAGAGAVATFFENQRAAWMMGMGSPPQSATLRSPTTKVRLDDYGGGCGSSTSTPVKRSSYLKSYRSGSSEGGGKSSLNMTSILGPDEDDDSPATPPTVKAKVRRVLQVSGSESGTSSGEDGHIVMDDDYAFGMGSLGNDSDSVARSVKEATASTEESSLAPSVFEREGTETSLGSDHEVTSGGHRIVSALGVKPMPSLPEDPSSGSGLGSSSSSTTGGDVTP